MAERALECPECRSRFVRTEVVHNPDTLHMNARATLRCEECKHTWEGYVTTPRHEELRRRGRRR